MKVFIIGGNGQIGYELCALLKGADIPHYAPPHEQLDLNGTRQIHEVIAEYRPTIVINTAGYRNAAQAESEPSRCFSLNRDAPAALAKACNQYKAALMHISSWRVFNGMKQDMYTVKDTPNPSGALGNSFWQGEQQIREHCPHHVILRLSWVISARGRNRLTGILDSLANSKPVKASANNRGRPTLANDIARVIIAIMRQINCNANIWETYHYNATETIDEVSFAEVILAEASRYRDFPPNPSELFPKPCNSGKTVNACLDATHLRNTFGIHAKPWRSSVARLIRNIYVDGEK